MSVEDLPRRHQLAGSQAREADIDRLTDELYAKLVEDPENGLDSRVRTRRQKKLY